MPTVHKRAPSGRKRPGKHIFLGKKRLKWPVLGNFLCICKLSRHFDGPSVEKKSTLAEVKSSERLIVRAPSNRRCAAFLSFGGGLNRLESLADSFDFQDRDQEGGAEECCR